MLDLKVLKRLEQPDLKINKLDVASTTLIFVLSVLVQILLIGKFLDNSIVSQYVPSAVDALDYANRAEIWKHRGFNGAFEDVYRVPGYPTFILLTTMAFPQVPFFALKIMQLLGLAISACLIKAILEGLVSRKLALLGGVIFSILPLWHFTPLVLAESLTSTFFIFLLFKLSKSTNRVFKRHFLIYVSVIITVLIYLKPNNILLLVPTTTLLFFINRALFLKYIGSISVAVVILILPWINFAKSAQPGFHGITTNSGINLYVGTGMIVEDNGGVLSNAARRWGVDSKNNPKDVLVTPDGLSPWKVNALYQSRAVRIWKDRPLKQFGYGIEKALIAFGVKGNSHSDYLIGLFNATALLLGFTLVRSSRYKAWGYTCYSTFLALSLQAIIFQADRRFVVPIFFPIATICITLGFASILSRMSSECSSCFKQRAM